jgi:hypothetical protein
VPFNNSLSIYAMISLGSSEPVFEKAELEAPLCTLLGDASLGEGELKTLFYRPQGLDWRLEICQ